MLLTTIHEAWLEPRAEEFPDRSMDMKDIQRQLPKKPVSRSVLCSIDFDQANLFDL
jgi:hypothetical protein